MKASFKIVPMLAVFFLLASTTGSGPSDNTAAYETYETAVTILASVAAFDCGDSNCESEDCEQEYPELIGYIHDIHMTPAGNDDSYDHEEDTCLGCNDGCDCHDCQVIGGDADLQTLAAQLRGLNGQQLHDLLKTSANFTINWNRESAQVIGCGRKIILNVPLREEQLLNLGADRAQ